jgi:hypothetical protein
MVRHGWRFQKFILESDYRRGHNSYYAGHTSCYGWFFTINPGTDSAYWKFEFQESSLAYYSYKGGGSWNPEIWNPLKPGNHTVLITVAGKTSIPAQHVNLMITLYLEIIPAS